jgi:hypothetical protein
MIGTDDEDSEGEATGGSEAGEEGWPAAGIMVVQKPRRRGRLRDESPWQALPTPP